MPNPTGVPVTLMITTRILTQRGSDNAAKLGLLMQEQRILPDQIISSDAARAAETATLVGKGLNYAGQIELRRELYLASPDNIAERH